MGGVQKRGTAHQIDESKDYLDHIIQALGASSPMAAEIGLRPEITDSLDWLHATGQNSNSILGHRGPKGPETVTRRPSTP